MQKLNQKYINSVVRQALKEDLYPKGDITTNLINFRNKIIKAKIISGQDGIVSGLDFSKASFKLIGKETVFKAKIKDGKQIKKNRVIAEIKAKIKTILTAERTALNFLNHASGISTLTNQFVKKVGKKTKICCTRKTTPNLRLLEKYAVKMGGGYNHRYNLSDEFLIKDNHIAISDIKKIVSSTNKNKKITVEVDNLLQFKKIKGQKFNTVLFDNMKIKNLKIGVQLAKKYYETEASGNVNLKSVKSIAATGVNRISIGSITHSAPTFDFKLEI